jgi:hypothetical protein
MQASDRQMLLYTSSKTYVYSTKVLKGKSALKSVNIP